MTAARLKPHDTRPMRSYPASTRINHAARLMRCYPVTTRINSVAHDDEECSAPVELAKVQNSLFS